MPTYKNYKNDFYEKFLCGVLRAALAVGLAFSVAPHTAVRTADAVSMKAEESATVAQTIADCNIATT